MRHVKTAERRALIGHRHRLVPDRRSDDPVEITTDLVALHSSDPATVFLSCFARMINGDAAVVEAALYDDRTLLRHHAMRRTLWISTPPLVVAMHASSTRKVAATERRRLLKVFGDTPWIDDPERTLAGLQADLIALIESDGPMTTREIGSLRPEMARKVTLSSGAQAATVGAHTRIASLTGFEAQIIRGRPQGSWIGSEYTWHPIEAWTSADFASADQRASSALVVQAWLSRFGPGTEADLRWWTGWTAANVRRALGDIGAVEVTLDDDKTGWVSADDPLLHSERPEVAEPWVAVLPGLDPTTMGWKERDWYVDDAVRARVFDRNGNAGPTIWRNGEVVGGWVQQPSGDLATELVHKLDAHESALLDSELERIQTAIGDIRFRVRFPAPNQKALLG